MQQNAFLGDFVLVSQKVRSCVFK